MKLQSKTNWELHGHRRILLDIWNEIRREIKFLKKDALAMEKAILKVDQEINRRSNER